MFWWESNRLNFYKTLFARMGNIKAGQLIDPETSENLSDVETVLSGYGIKLRDSNQEFRNFGNVLDEVNSKWGTFGTVGQRAIAVAFSGTRQQEKFLTLMEGYDEALKYAEVSANSLGTAEEKFNNAYLGSIEARVNEFKASYEALSNSFINDDAIKSIVSGGTDIINVLDGIVDMLGSIPTLATVAAGALSGISNKGELKVIYVSFLYIINTESSIVPTPFY